MSIKNAFTKSLTYLLVFSTLCSPILGATTTEKKVLPLKEAVKSAINTSTSLKLLEKETQTNSYILEHSNTSNYSDQDLAYKNRQIQQKTSYFKDKLEYLTESNYNQLIISDLNLELLDKQIQSLEKDVKVLELQLSLGYTDQLSLKSKKAELDKLKNTKLSTEASITKLKEDFRILTNLDVDDYTLENTITYEPFRANSSINAYIGRRLEEMETFSKEYAEYFESSIGARISTPGSNEISESAYANSVLQSKQNYGNITIQRNNNTQTLLGQYTLLIDKEKTIENTKSQIDVLDKQIQATKLKLDRGLATSIEYEKLLLQKEQLENSLLNTTYEHLNIKRILDKPWVYLSLG